jgi:carbamoylphosphate synthase large subunit
MQKNEQIVFAMSQTKKKGHYSETHIMGSKVIDVVTANAGDDNFQFRYKLRMRAS